MPRNLANGSRLVDLGVVCLVCLRAEPGYCSIYGQDLETPHMQIVDKIRSCSALQLDRPLLSQLPDKICHGCRNELSITYRFQQKCLEAQKVFQSAATATLLLDVDKLQLEQQQQLKLPSSLKIKRLETEPASSKIKYYPTDDQEEVEQEVVEEEDNVKQENGQAMATIVLQDVPAVVEDKILALSVADWSTEGIETEQQCEEQVPDLEQDLVQELEVEQKLDQDDDDDDNDYKLGDELQSMPCITVTSSGSNLIPTSVTSRNRRTTEPKICDICGNTYKYQHALNAHMRRHNNERPYPCEVCQKAFISNVELRRHMRVHTGQKPYGCHYCDRRFSDFGSSKKHERIHTGERPYVCEVCNKGFAYAHVLSVHKRTHTGKKQFQCTQCEKGFTKKSYLVTHLEQHRVSQASVLQLGTTTLQRLPTRKQQRQQQQRVLEQRQVQQQQKQREEEHQSHHLSYEDHNDEVDEEDAYDDDHEEDEDDVSVGIGIGTLSQVSSGDQAKVLEECIVTNDFMFNDEEADEADHDMDDYHDADLDDNEFQSVQHVKVPYSLVGDLLDAEDLVSDTKYLMD